LVAKFNLNVASILSKENYRVSPILKLHSGVDSHAEGLLERSDSGAANGLRSLRLVELDAF
jgi:hypothetical protein